MPSQTFLLIPNFNEVQLIWMTLIGLSGRAWHFHSFSKFLKHFGKIHLCCGPSLHLYPREFKCKMWIEKDFKRYFESLTFQRKQKKLVLEPGRKRRPDHWPPSGKEHSCLSALQSRGQCQQVTYMPRSQPGKTVVKHIDLTLPSSTFGFPR